jgi:hypothetical protein
MVLYDARGHRVYDPQDEEKPLLTVEEIWRRVTGKELPPPMTPEEEAAWEAELAAIDEQHRRIYGDDA